MSYFDNFFNEHEVRIGKDYTSNTPVYIHSLHEGFSNYFETFKTKRDLFHISLDFNNLSRENIAFSLTDSESTTLAILGFHRFFELFIKDILRRVNHFLPVKFLENEKQVVKYLMNATLKAEEVKTIEYAETIKRFKEINSYSKANPDNPHKDFISKYEFLLTNESQDFLNKLSVYRNRLMHNGNNLPNIFALDYLVSQGLVPIILKIAETEKENWNGYVPHYFETFTGIKIIERISQIKYSFEDFTNNNKHESLRYSLLELGHLKELGRASINFYPFRKSNILFYESYYDNPNGRDERFAESEKSYPNFYDLKSCPCCGIKSLVVYRKEFKDLFTDGMDFISWFKCYACDYSLKNNTGDPYYLGLSKEKLFAEK
jgi:hypothetical protein